MITMTMTIMMVMTKDENVFTVDDADVDARCSMMMSATNLKVLPLSVNLQSRLTTCCDGDTK